MFDIYTDGGCDFRKNGLGAWAFIVVDKGSVVHKASEASWQQTNNTMEMMAVIKALEWVPEGGLVQITSDSQYVIRGAENWSKQWIKDGWKTYDKKAVKNKDLWVRLLDLKAKRKVIFVHVRGHAGNQWNERCDELCTAHMKSLYDADGL